MFDRSSVKEGMRVRAADGRQLGRIVRLDEDCALVEQGSLVPREYRVPYARISAVQGGQVLLGAAPLETSAAPRAASLASERPAGRAESAEVDRREPPAGERPPE